MVYCENCKTDYSKPVVTEPKHFTSGYVPGTKLCPNCGMEEYRNQGVSSNYVASRLDISRNRASAYMTDLAKKGLMERLPNMDPRHFPGRPRFVFRNTEEGNRAADEY